LYRCIAREPESTHPILEHPSLMAEHLVNYKE
jgi:hypothetical protein